MYWAENKFPLAQNNKSIEQRKNIKTCKGKKTK